MSIGERISELRKSAGLSQGELAGMLGITRQAVSKWENDLSSPDTIKLIQLSDVLNTEVEYLATGKKPIYENAADVVFVKQQEPAAERIVEKIIERPVIKTVVRKVIRYRYRQDPLTLFVTGIACLLVGILLGWLIR